MALSKPHSSLGLAAIVSVTVALLTGHIDPTTYVAIMSGLGFGAVGYINGKKNGSNNDSESQK